MINNYDTVIIGGGAAGFFTAINLATLCPKSSIAILERGKEVLTKVKVSGGGRCNVTHAEFDPKPLTQYYPRGEKELLGPFHTFMTGDTMAWFEERGVELKIEEDGRIFPVTDSSQTIIDCFLSEVDRLGVQVLMGHSVKGIEREEELWNVHTSKMTLIAKQIVVATGSNPKIWKLLKDLNHTMVEPVPSLFTFHIDDPRIESLPGVSTPAKVTIVNDEGKSLLESEGPLLITHWGMSGPAILKLSAWGARLLAPKNYQFSIEVNWLHDRSYEMVLEDLMILKTQFPKQTIRKYAQFDLPKRLWRNLLLASGIEETETWANVNKQSLNELAVQLTTGRFEVTGKSTFKEEFVTAGGVDLREVHFKTFESKKQKDLYFAGEVLNIDAITGGFNFQNAWTGGYMVAKAISENER